jgi:glycosyltransferase involved in cell wall biosynthesis
MTLRLPLTSVLINNYNNAPFLEHCLSSVFSQIPAPDEVILYDDGSTDESLRIAERYAAKLKILARPHGLGTPMENQARAIEAAFRESTGELVFLLDGDDAFLPGKIAAYIEAFASAADVIMVQAPLEKIDDSGRTLGIEFEPARHQTNYVKHIYSEHELNIYYPTSALAFRRSYLERRLPLDQNEGTNIWPDARLALVAPLFGTVIAIPRPITQWRRHSGSHTVVKHTAVYRLVRLNQSYFNAFCRASGRPTISPWRSRHHRKRWLRHYFIPDSFVNFFRVIRWKTLSEGKKRQMLMGPNPAEMERELQRLRRQGLDLP